MTKFKTHYLIPTNYFVSDSYDSSISLVSTHFKRLVLPNWTTQVDPPRNCTPERSENSSSSSQTCSSVSSRKPSLLTMLQERDEEIKKLRQELQETKEQNSMLSWEKSVLEQEITEKTLIYSSEMQTMQSKVAEMTDELAMQK